MALCDVAKGWGTLPGNILSWHCPACEAESDVADWQAVSQVINQRNVDGRKCPKCSYLSWSCGDTHMMVKQQEKAEVAKAEKIAADTAALKEDTPEPVDPEVPVAVDAALQDADEPEGGQ